MVFVIPRVIRLSMNTCESYDEFLCNLMRFYVFLDFLSQAESEFVGIIVWFNVHVWIKSIVWVSVYLSMTWCQVYIVLTINSLYGQQTFSPIQNRGFCTVIKSGLWNKFAWSKKVFFSFITKKFSLILQFSNCVTFY